MLAIVAITYNFSQLLVFSNDVATRRLMTTTKMQKVKTRNALTRIASSTMKKTTILSTRVRWIRSNQSQTSSRTMCHLSQIVSLRLQRRQVVLLGSSLGQYVSFRRQLQLSRVFRSASKLWSYRRS
jgi:hypothetical protein